MSLAEQRKHRAQKIMDFVGDNETFGLIVDLLDDEAWIYAGQRPGKSPLFYVRTKGREYMSRGHTITDAIETVWRKMTAGPDSGHLPQ